LEAIFFLHERFSMQKYEWKRDSYRFILYSKMYWRIAAHPFVDSYRTGNELIDVF
jgi:hypothetical protein